MTKYTQLQVKEFASASTIAEEIISSVKTAQAFGAQAKLSKLYDNTLATAQRAGYKMKLAESIMISLMFFAVYAFYALGFCTILSS
jgi:ATP-binding cassette, subfamily B (MDR/TAP), member 1